MGQSETSSKDSSDGLFRLLITCLILATLYWVDQFLKPEIKSFFTSSFWTALLSLAAVSLTALVIATSLSWNAWHKRREVQCITEEDAQSVYLGEEI